MAVTDKKPKCKLIGTDGNVFALAGRVNRALKSSKLPNGNELSKEFSKRLFACDSYDAALTLMREYVEVE